MPESIANTVFMKILPVLLTAAIIWMMSSINNMQVKMVRIDEQVIASHRLLQTTATSLDSVEATIVNQQITVTLLQHQLETLRRDYEQHMDFWHGGD